MRDLAHKEGEGRAAARVPFTAQVRFYQWDRARMGQATQISAGGLFLKTASPLAEGALITLRLALPGVEQAFTVLARVVRTVRGGLFAEAGMGLKFVDIASPHRALIASYVTTRLA